MRLCSALRFFNDNMSSDWENLVAGFSGGLISTLVLHPLDLVKVRFQGVILWNATNSPIDSMIPCFDAVFAMFVIACF